MLKNIDSEQWGIIIQTFSVIIAMVASVASWRVASITSKQYKLNRKNSESKTKPIFIIEKIYPENNGLFLSIENVGFPSFQIKEVNSSNDKIRIDSHYNGEISFNKEKKEDRIFIKIFFEKDTTGKAVISLSGIDVNGDDFCFEPPEFIIEKGRLTNGVQIHKQFFMDKINQ